MKTSVVVIRSYAIYHGISAIYSGIYSLIFYFQSGIFNSKISNILLSLVSFQGFIPAIVLWYIAKPVTKFFFKDEKDSDLGISEIFELMFVFALSYFVFLHSINLFNLIYTRIYKINIDMPEQVTHLINIQLAVQSISIFIACILIYKRKVISKYLFEKATIKSV